MQYILCPSHDATFHLALEEYLLNHTGSEFFFFWRSASCVVIGKHQSAFLEVDTRYAEKESIPVYRRSSGGGAVYHDLGNLNFSYIKNLEPGTLVGYDVFLNPMAKALCKLGIPVERRNKSDLFIGDGKISGNAQSVRRGRVLHHGTLLFHSDLSILEKLLFVSHETMQTKGIRSNRSHVVNIQSYLPSLDIDSFQKELFAELFPCGLEQYTLTKSDLTSVEVLQEKQYKQWNWNFGRSPALRIESSLPHTPSLAVEKGRITCCKHPDLSSQANDALIGLEYSYTILKHTLRTLPSLASWNEPELEKLADSFFAGASR